jgi:hypothetical protein
MMVKLDNRTTYIHFKYQFHGLEFPVSDLDFPRCVLFSYKRDDDVMMFGFLFWDE